MIPPLTFQGHLSNGIIPNGSEHLVSLHRVAVSERISTGESILLHCEMLCEYRAYELVTVVFVVVVWVHLFWL